MSPSEYAITSSTASCASAPNLGSSSNSRRRNNTALFIDWGAHQTIPEDSHLWDYIAAKAEISPKELFALLPEKVTVGQRSKGGARNIKIAEYLLQSTRSTPRELTLLMKRLQDEVPTEGYVTSDRVRSAVDNFASRDLLTIVQAEATGTLATSLQENLEGILSNLPVAVGITREDILGALRAVGLATELAGALTEFLFMAGLIGNFNPYNQYVQFYHRRDTYKFKRQGPWILHRGLTRLSHF
jgi:hypothetical protein